MTVENITPVVDLSGVNTFDDALAALQAAGVVAEKITEYGDGFILADKKDKAALVGVPFIIVDSTVRVDKETDREYTSFRIVTGDGRKLVVNDGSQGIHTQGIALSAKRGTLAGLVVEHGLTGGEYTIEIDGKMEKASTFYFAGL